MSPVRIEQQLAEFFQNRADICSAYLFGLDDRVAFANVIRARLEHPA